MKKDSIYRWLVESDIKNLLHGCHEVEFLEAALDGDPDAARSLLIHAPDDLTGLLVTALYECGVPPEVLQKSIKDAWTWDHSNLVAAAGSRKRLRAMFRYADFSVPENLPAVVKVWRGTFDGSFSRASGGYCWTLDRDVACYHAIHNVRTLYPAPLLLVREVSKTDIAMCLDDDEKTVVILSHGEAVVDGTLKDWEEGFNRRIAVLRAKG